MTRILVISDVHSSDNHTYQFLQVVQEFICPGGLKCQTFPDRWTQQSKPLRLAQWVRFKEDSAYWGKLTLHPVPVSQRMSHCMHMSKQEREHGYGSVLTYMALKVLLEQWGFGGAGVAPFLQEPHRESNESLQRSHPKMAYEHLQVDARQRQ